MTKLAAAYRALGLMSGTSRDGIDAAIIETDGQDWVRTGPSCFLPYEPEMRHDLAQAVARARQGGFEVKTEMASIEARITMAHQDAVDKLLQKSCLAPDEIDLIGFHGHTLFHDPKNGLTWQIGDAGALARASQIDVVADFRSRDVVAGGEGAPLVPAYHRALFRACADDRIKDQLVAILNIGGVANITWLDLRPDHPDSADEARIMAFDCGPGNALIDDWVLQSLGVSYDKGGRLAAKGRSDEGIIKDLMAHPFFARPAPKSLDRDAFSLQSLKGLSAEDGAATLTDFTVRAIGKARAHFPHPVDGWYVTGGGRHNGTLMRQLADHLAVPVKPVEQIGWNGDVLEAEAFAYLAVRSKLGLAISWPQTTGVPKAMSGGRLFPHS
ncbi:anhydro-N-acetylmuramic acid kinase [alpha proteobacterium Q-1]|nr:anhydro-N-acetylmuramic acid kinase [alpha proteobacterium Q-1]